MNLVSTQKDTHRYSNPDACPASLTLTKAGIMQFTTVAQISRDTLTDTQREINRYALMQHIPLWGRAGRYSRRTDVVIDKQTGYILVPCIECGKQVRTVIDLDQNGEVPIAHREEGDVYYEADFATCAKCLPELRYAWAGRAQ